MKDYIIKINTSTRYFELPFGTEFGVSGENRYQRLVFELDETIDGVGWLEIEKGLEKGYILMENTLKGYAVEIKNSLLTCDELTIQLRVTSSIEDENAIVFKSKAIKIPIAYGINSTATIPEEYPQWIDIANSKIEDIDKALSDTTSAATYAQEQGDYAKKTADNIGKVSEYVIRTADEAKEKSEEAISISKGANPSLSFGNYGTMVSVFNSLDNQTYKVGQNVLIVTLNVPDLWISEIAEESVIYTYTTDEAITTLLQEQGYIQMGYYKLSALETQKVDLKGYVKDTDYATYSKAGLVRPTNGLTLVGANKDAIGIVKATDTQIDTRTDNYAPIVPSNLDYAVKSVGNPYYVKQVEYSQTSTLPSGSDGGYYGRAYIRDKTNNENSIPLCSQNRNYTLPIRDHNGNFYVGTPTIAFHCANKQYVDNLHITLTQAEYDALATKDANTYYYIVEE